MPGPRRAYFHYTSVSSAHRDFSINGFDEKRQFWRLAVGFGCLAVVIVIIIVLTTVFATEAVTEVPVPKVVITVAAGVDAEDVLDAALATGAAATDECGGNVQEQPAVLLYEATFKVRNEDTVVGHLDALADWLEPGCDVTFGTALSTRDEAVNWQVEAPFDCARNLSDAVVEDLSRYIVKVSTPSYITDIADDDEREAQEANWAAYGSGTVFDLYDPFATISTTKDSACATSFVADTAMPANLTQEITQIWYAVEGGEWHKLDLVGGEDD